MLLLARSFYGFKLWNQVYARGGVILISVKQEMSSFNARHHGEPLHPRHQPVPVLIIYSATA